MKNAPPELLATPEKATVFEIGVEEERKKMGMVEHEKCLLHFCVQDLKKKV